MPYIGTLDSTRPFRFESNASLRGVVTVRWLKPGGTVDIELLPGTVPTQDVTIPRKTSRVIFEVAPGPGTAMLFKLSQDNVVVEETLVGDALFVFDVV